MSRAFIIIGSAKCDYIIYGRFDKRCQKRERKKNAPHSASAQQLLFTNCQPISNKFLLSVDARICHTYSIITARFHFFWAHAQRAHRAQICESLSAFSFPLNGQRNKTKWNTNSERSVYCASAIVLSHTFDSHTASLLLLLHWWIIHFLFGNFIWMLLKSNVIDNYHIMWPKRKTIKTCAECINKWRFDCADTVLTIGNDINCACHTKINQIRWEKASGRSFVLCNLSNVTLKWKNHLSPS